MGGCAMRWIVAALTALTLGAGPARACPETACETDGGHYLAALPEGAPRGLLMFLHGWGGRADAQLRETATVGPWLEAGWVVVAPQGEPRREGDAGGAWNSAAQEGRRDDVAFLRAVLEDADARFGAGGPRVAAGFSGGGMMVWRLACDAPDSADAYAPVAGLLWAPLPRACAGPVRLLHAHGWRDEVVPMEGRAVGGGVRTQGDLFAGLALLRAASACRREAPDDYAEEGPFLIRFWRECAPGARLGLALHPGGHSTPAAWAAVTMRWLAGG